MLIRDFRKNLAYYLKKLREGEELRVGDMTIICTEVGMEQIHLNPCTHGKELQS